jgi:hypothetical protein
MENTMLKKTSSTRVLAVALALALVGCGGGSSSSSDPADAFAGTWIFDSGSIDGTCAGTALAPIDLTGDPLTITKVDATHVAVMLSGNGLMCDVTFQVSGTTGTATGNPTCVFPVNIGGTTMNVTANITSWTLDISSGTLSMSMAGTASICSATGSGTATKQATDAGAGG